MFFVGFAGQNARWCDEENAVRWHVGCDHAIGADLNIVANPDIAHHNGPHTKIDIVAYHGAFVVAPMVHIGNSQGHALPD